MTDRVKEGGRGFATEDVREELKRKLLEGIASGPAKPFRKADWKRLRAEAARRIAAGSKRRR